MSDRSRLRLACARRRLSSGLGVVALGLVIAPAAHAASAAADSAAAWTHLGAATAKARTAKKPQVDPDRFAAFTLDQGALASVLKGAPAERLRSTDPDTLTISIPNPAGSFERFAIVDSPVMEPALAAAHPDIRTFAGRSIDHPGDTVRLDLTPLGFHASVRGDSGSWFVDPRYADRSQYASYTRAALPTSPYGPFAKGRNDEVRAPDGTPDSGTSARAGEANGALVRYRTYRLALVSDPTYAAYVGNVTAAKATLINRVDQLYEADLAIHMNLIAGNDNLNLDTTAKATGANGPCGPSACFTSSQLSSCTSSTLTRTNTDINTIVGAGSYDIGHIALGTDGGGLAALGVVGSTDKGQGCTGITTPVGDVYAVDYVAHEMGHQFGGDHTFNGLVSNCSGSNRSASYSVEPGSGTSVMAYAGICGTDDLQPHSDPYFSQASIAEISAFVTSPESGGSTHQGNTVTTTANHTPDVSTPPGFTIPTRTPFTLTASGSDLDGNPLTYLWEQNDIGSGTGTGLVSNTKTNGPLFRVFGTAARYANPNDALVSPSPGENMASSVASRTFPDMPQILAGNTNAASGTCPTAGAAPVADAIVDCYSEFLPTADWIGVASDRTLHFRVSARDNVAQASGVGKADAALVVAPNAGPFRLTSQAAASSVVNNAQLPVTWNVANTNAAPVSVANVKISLSTDNGLTFPYVLAASTPNDGSESVTLPAIATTQGRVKVEAVGNIFFDASTGVLTVTSSGATLSGPTSQDFGAADRGASSAAQTITFSNDGDAATSIGTASVTGPDAAAFAITQDACSSTSLAARMSCTISVRMAPPAAGAQSATLSLPSTAAAGPVSVALTGTGTEPAVTTTPATPTTSATTTTITTPILPPKLPPIVDPLVSFAKSAKAVRLSRIRAFTYSFTARPGVRGTITIVTVRKITTGTAKKRVSKVVTLKRLSWTANAKGVVTVKVALSATNAALVKRLKSVATTVKVLSATRSYSGKLTVRPAKAVRAKKQA